VRNVGIPDDTLRRIVDFTAENLINSGTSAEEVRLMMQVTEPFRSHWAATEDILNERFGGRGDD
jgi:hypothetical protein